VQQFANGGAFLQNPTHPWETSEQVDMVEQRPAKARRCLGVILGNMTDDVSQIV
jgi:hypothetical protein